MATITLDPNTTYQVHSGLEMGVDLEWLYRPEALALLSTIIDQAVNIYGVSRLNPGSYCGIENTTDYYQLWLNAGHNFGSDATWLALRAHLYEVKNTATLATAIIDDQINQLITPFRTALAARNESLTYVFRYVAYTGDTAKAGDGTYDHASTTQIADFYELLWNHVSNTFGFVWDYIYPINEPDHPNTNASWQTGTGTAVGDRIKAIGDRLTTAGYTPRFSAPSTAGMDDALVWIPNVKAVSGISSYLYGYDYHAYNGVSDQNIIDLGALALADSRAVGVGEFWGPTAGADNSRSAVSKYMRTGRCAWFEPTTLPDLFEFDSATTPTAIVGPSTLRDSRYWRQWFAYIRPGATRIGSSSNSGSWEDVAYRNSNGTYVVVANVVNTSGSLTITGLPAGTYGINYTTSSAFNTSLSNQTLSTGQDLTTSIPAAGVISVYDTSYLTAASSSRRVIVLR